MEEFVCFRRECWSQYSLETVGLDSKRYFRNTCKCGKRLVGKHLSVSSIPQSCLDYLRTEDMYICILSPVCYGL